MLAELEEAQYCVSTVHSDEEVSVLVLRGEKFEEALDDNVCCDCCKVEVNVLMEAVALESCCIPLDRLDSRDARRWSLLES